MNTKHVFLTVIGLAVAFFTVASTNGQEPSAQPSQAPTATPADSNAQAAGKATYVENCSSCHQPSGRGIEGAFPPLAGHVAELFTQRAGRDYLPRLVLFGLEGKITVKGNSYDGVMPPWSQLSDGQIAAVLNYIFHAWGNDKLLPTGFEPMQASDVAAARAQQLSAADVLALRQKFVTETPAADSTALPLTFTAQQVARGQTSYTENCENCHGPALNDGEYAPTLKGSIFVKRWENGSLAALYGKIKSTMPLDRPAELTEQSYVDVTAFLLSKNGYVAGDKELPADSQQQQKMSLKK